MKKEKEHFNKIESKILRVLFQQKIPLTIYEVAKECGISYPTARQYLRKIPKEILNKKKELTSTTYMFRMDLFEKETKKRNKN